MNVQEKNSKAPTGSDRPRLKTAIGTYGHTAAVKDGSIPIEGVDADMIEVKPIIGAFRRMVVNACYWTMGLEKKISAKSDVALVGEFKPTHFGFGKFITGRKPADYAK